MRRKPAAGRARRAVVGAVLAALAVSVAGQSVAQAPASPSTAGAAGPAAKSPVMTMEQYLDRVMMAESGGRTHLRSSSSTALGPYQFIERTFIEVARRSFPAETAQLSGPQLLARRTDPVFSRRVAEAFTRENARHLQANEIAATWTNLRLAFLLGPGGAVKLLKAPPETRLAKVLTPGAMLANPFMAALTAQTLMARAAREVGVPSAPQVVVTQADRMRAMALAFVSVNEARIAATSAASQVSLARAGAPVVPPPPPPAPMPAPSVAELPSAGLFLPPVEGGSADGIAPVVVSLVRKAAANSIPITCNLNLPSCRKWLALKQDHLKQDHLKQDQRSSRASLR